MLNWLNELIQFTNPQHLIAVGGLTVVLAVVFIESGLFFGFFLPGDSLLFTAGLLCSNPNHSGFATPIGLLIIYLILSCSSGSLAGYLFGYLLGDYIGQKKDTLFFKQKHLKLTRSFYSRHEHLTFIMGRFLPIIRTFVPILAGIIKMRFYKFMFLNVIGCVLWVSSVTLVGYFLGILIPQLVHYLEYIVLFLVIVTMIPVVRTYLKEKRELAALEADGE